VDGFYCVRMVAIDRSKNRPKPPKPPENDCPHTKIDFFVHAIFNQFLLNPPDFYIFRILKLRSF